MITEDYCSFEVAKLLKEKGFDVYTYAYYEDEDNPNISLYGSKAINWNKTEFISKPTLQTAMKWLREAHNLNIGILFGHLRDFKTHWNFYIEGIELGRESMFFHTYEEACEAAIKYCLENLI